jgi:hypothetical protein
MHNVVDRLEGGSECTVEKTFRMVLMWIRTTWKYLQIGTCEMDRF